MKAIEDGGWSICERERERGYGPCVGEKFFFFKKKKKLGMPWIGKRKKLN